MSETITSEMDFGPYPVSEVRHYMIKMNDGIHLAVKLWLPWKDDGERFGSFKKWVNIIYEGSGPPEVDKYPAILEYLPYRKDDNTAARDRSRHTWFASHGFVCCRADMRGSGSSEGYYFDEYEPTEQSDCVQLIEWLSTQSWSNGNVGMYGMNWGGFNGLQVAYLQPPALKAVISLWSCVDRFAKDCYYSGGCVLGSGLPTWCSRMAREKAEAPDPHYFPDTKAWMDAYKDRLEKSTNSWSEIKLKHQTKDDYWKHASIAEDYERVKCAVLSIGGLSDGYPSSALCMAAHLNPKCRAIVGPWSHSWPDVSDPGPRIDFLNLCLMWWSYYLKGQHPEYLSSWPRLQLFVQEDTKPSSFYGNLNGSFVSIPEWKEIYQQFQDESESPNVTRFFLTGDHTLSPQEESGSSRLQLKAHSLQGANAGEWFPANGHHMARDQTLANEHSLCFTSDQLADDLVIGGFSKLHLELTLDHVGLQAVAARLCHQHPNGQSTRIAYGITNLGNNKTKFKNVRATIELTPNGYKIPKGHKLCLALSPTYFPMMCAMPQVQGITVHPEKSNLVLQVLTAEDMTKTTTFNPPKPLLKMLAIDKSEGSNVPYSYDITTKYMHEGTEIKTTSQVPKTYYPELGVEFGETHSCAFKMPQCCSMGHVEIEGCFEKSYPDLHLDIEILGTHKLIYGQTKFTGEDHVKVSINKDVFFEREAKYDIDREFA